ncbi:diphosphate--fructose-6-phosphate 1-phosphotransferase [Uliginosibacterium sp. H3]|uniref:Diphosphate--fructose-6-phosphate 1-phosphotransferase n=1 Tax=Uliginosibacterium silvisoli TaxID=3114758 RepID=A0ABU6K997_9RHOO|nr:diphosphate--fructose-6-phosphate 1-phosphotransferase [Uliginosibacterium sp. H3]
MTSLNDTLTQTEQHRSLLEEALRSLPLPIVPAFGSAGNLHAVEFVASGEKLATASAARVAELFPRTVAANAGEVLRAGQALAKAVTGKRVAVLFSGGPAPGGHNVVVGLKQMLGAGNTLLGVQGGPKGLLNGRMAPITDADIAVIRNTGGFDFLGTDRTKIKTAEQFAQVREVSVKHELDAIVIIGGDDSNTNAAVLAEELFANVHADGRGVQVIGVPKTIDGDLQLGELLPISFGFDTATRVYAELVGNILQDSRSSLKYWHFIKLMGRAASHVTLEVALQTKPAVTLISEEIAQRKQSLAEIIEQIAQTVVARAKKGIHHGVLLVPEGLIEFIPEMKALIEELNDGMAQHEAVLAALEGEEKRAFVTKSLSPEHEKLFASLPEYIQDMLLAERDSHGNLQLSLIPTEQLLIDMTKRRVREIADASGTKIPFATQNHFFGYEGRCGAPTLFDAAYTLNLGLTAGALLLAGKTGYMASVGDIFSGGVPLAIPLAGLLDVERRHGSEAVVIEKALVEIDAPAMQYFVSRREAWAQDDLFASPGPRQLWGPVASQLPISVALNRKSQSLAFQFGTDKA